MDDEQQSETQPVLAQLTLEELLAQITPENLHGEIDTGDPVGNEMQD